MPYQTTRAARAITVRPTGRGPSRWARVSSLTRSTRASTSPPRPGKPLRRPAHRSPPADVLNLDAPLIPVGSRADRRKFHRGWVGPLRRASLFPGKRERVCAAAIDRGSSMGSVLRRHCSRPLRRSCSSGSSPRRARLPTTRSRARPSTGLRRARPGRSVTSSTSPAMPPIWRNGYCGLGAVPGRCS